MNNNDKEVIYKLYNDREFNNLISFIRLGNAFDDDKVIYLFSIINNNNDFLTLLNKEEVNSLFNNNVINKLKLNEINDNNKKLVGLIFKYLKFLPDYFVNNINSLFLNNIFNFNNLCIDDAYLVLNKYFNMNKNNINYDNYFKILNSFKTDIIINLVDNYDLFISKDIILEKLVINNYDFCEKYFNSSNYSISRLFNDEAKKRVLQVLNIKEYNYINDDNFVKIITSIRDENLFRGLMYQFDNKLDTSILERARRKIIRRNIRFYLGDMLDEALVGYLFGDYYHNIRLDINEMINYDNCDKLVDENHIKFYKLILDLSNMSDKEKLDIFDKFKFLDIKSMFYDDIRICKNDCYKRLMSSNIELNDDILDKSFSRKYNWDVYRLNGQPFKALVKCFRKTPDFDVDEIMESRDGYSFSIISNTNFGTIGKGNTSYTLLFSNLDYSNIVHINTNDSYSDYNRTNMDYASQYLNEIKDPDNFLFNTNSYNELVIAKNNSMTPTAFICYEDVKEREVILAKKLHLPILIIEKSKYKEYKSSCENLNDTYRR